MIGEVIYGFVPSLGKHPMEFKILSVDVGGLWVESQEYVEGILKILKKNHAQFTPIIFLPFSSISYMVLLHDSLSLSERSLGIKNE